MSKQFTVAVLLWVCAGHSLVGLAADPSTRETTSMQNEAGVEQRAQALQARFRQLDSDQIKGADVLANPDRHGLARQRLAEFRAITAARIQLEQDILAAGEQFIVQRAPNEAQRNQVLAVFRTGLPDMRARIAELAAAYARLADGYQDTLDWAAGQAGNLKARDGVLVVSQAQQRDTFVALEQSMAEAAAACDAADRQLGAVEAQRRERMAEFRRTARPLP